MIRILAAPIAITLAVTLSGCAGHCTVVPERVSTASEMSATSHLPEWVRMVHPTSDGRDIYVGGCSMAPGPEEGVELASADAFSQMTERAGKYFTRAFTGAVENSDTELSSIDRRDFRQEGLDLYAEYVIGTARLDRVHFQECETGRAHDSLPDRWSGGPVCRTFVELSLDTADWGRMLDEAIIEMRHEYSDGGRSNLVELADWMLANITTPERDPNARANVR